MNKAALARLAADVRRDFALSEDDPFDPFRWSKEHGIPFISLREITSDEAAMRVFLEDKPQVWSAALVRDGNRHFVIYNPERSEERVRSDLTHEVSHFEAEHELSPAWITDDGGCGGASKPQEGEAAELAGALLVPVAAAKEAAIYGRAPSVVAARYRVSVEMATWRMNVSGGYVIAQRARSRRGGRASQARSKF